MLRPKSTANTVPSTRLRWPTHSRRQRSAPAACGPSTRTRQKPNPDFLKTALDPSLIELLIVEAAENRRQAAQRPHQPELAGVAVNNKPETHLLREGEGLLGFAFRLGKRIARREKVCVQLGAAVGGENEIAVLESRLERAAQRIAAGPDMSRPGHHAISKQLIAPA